MSEYIADNPQFIVNRFQCAGITHALHGEEPAEDESTEVTSDNEDIDDMEKI